MKHVQLEQAPQRPAWLHIHSETIDEPFELSQRFVEEVLPEARKIEPALPRERGG
jgi:hypothetical protein